MLVKQKWATCMAALSNLKQLHELVQYVDIEKTAFTMYTTFLPA